MNARREPLFGSSEMKRGVEQRQMNKGPFHRTHKLQRVKCNAGDLRVCSIDGQIARGSDLTVRIRSQLIPRERGAPGVRDF